MTSTMVLSPPSYFSSQPADSQQQTSPPDYLTVTGTILGHGYNRTREPNSPARSSGSFVSQRTSSSVPAYSEGTESQPPAHFCYTTAFQIQAPGKPLISLPLPPRPDPVPIFSVDSFSNTVTDPTPRYISLRNERHSSSAVLISGFAPDGPAVATTLYRFGPTKPPRLRVFGTRPDGTPVDSRSPAELFDELKHNSKASELDACEGTGGDDDSSQELRDLRADGTACAGTWSAPMICPSLTSRAMRIVTPHGTFQWRYADRAERTRFDAPSVLVFERVVPVAEAYPSSSSWVPSNKKKTKGEICVPVGYFVRNDELRTPGTGRSTAGNGGRLMLDLRAAQASASSLLEKKEKDVLADDERCGPETPAALAIEKVAVASILTMLKKEVDRRRACQMAVIAGGASGGP